jgi:hypothetical protein
VAGSARFCPHCAHPFPGNVRGLSNLAQQLAISSRGHSVATLDDNVDDQRTSSNSEAEGSDHDPAKPTRPVKVTDAAIQDALRIQNYNFAAAAAALGINRSTLYERTRNDGIDVRNANSLADDEILDSHTRRGGNIVAMAKELRVSPQSLKARVNLGGHHSFQVSVAPNMPVPVLAVRHSRCMSRGRTDSADDARANVTYRRTRSVFATSRAHVYRQRQCLSRDTCVLNRRRQRSGPRLN